MVSASYHVLPTTDSEILFDIKKRKQEDRDDIFVTTNGFGEDFLVCRRYLVWWTTDDVPNAS